MAAVSVIERKLGADWEKVYQDALTINKVAPGTVCALQKHYSDGRHVVPYRMGYCHDFGEPTVHYHESYREHLLCKERL